MKKFLSKKIIGFVFIPTALLIILCTFSCKKSIDTQVDPFSFPPDLVTKVTSSVSGFVTDENDKAVPNASVFAGGITTTADRFGFFEIKNIQVVKSAAVVTVTESGYFKSIKTYTASENKAAFFRIKLIPKINVGNINAASGGNVSLTNGLIISFPANAVVDALTNITYTGQVNIAAHWINPVAADLHQTMPGDLRGIATDGSMKLLTTYGMAAVELTGSGGELLQIASGKKATLTMPIPSSILGNAPSTIPLWYFDETKGLWNQEGQAIKTGNTYVGEVSHFSFWNCDVPANLVQFNCTIKDQAGNAIPSTLVKISVIGNPNMRAHGYTDSSGYVAGVIPNNTQLLLEVFSNHNCMIHSQNLTTTSTNISLGIITINTSLNAAIVSGTVTDCYNNPVTNGFIMMQYNNQYSRYYLTNTGAFNLSTPLCNSSSIASFIAVDATTLQQSNTFNQTIVTGANTVGNLQACGFSADKFLYYRINGISYLYAAPADSIRLWAPNTPETAVWAWHIGGDGASFNFPTYNISLNSSQAFHSFTSPQFSSHVGYDSVHITEYGLPGQFIAGNYSGIMRSDSTGLNTNVTCSFRVRRP